MRIAIDGTAASGKGTLAKALAKALGYAYIDTGALYRAIAHLAYEQNVSWSDEAQLQRIAQSADLNFVTRGKDLLLFCGDEDLSLAIRQDHISKGASEVSVHVGVREALLIVQKEMAQQENVIMDGRDIASVIMPNADVKVFIDADVNIRAQRRLDQIHKKNPTITYESVLQDLQRRDHQDRTRDIAPLICVPDAKILDTSTATIEESLTKLLEWCQKQK